MYLSTEDEVNTVPILKNIFDMGKDVFVPKYKGKTMMMVKLHSLEDYESLPLTKWNIKQPADNNREDAIATGKLICANQLIYFDIQINFFPFLRRTRFNYFAWCCLHSNR